MAMQYHLRKLQFVYCIVSIQAIQNSPMHCITALHCVVIEGGSMSCLANAKRRLDIIVWSNRLKEPVTHFISIPLNHPIITEQLTVFKSQVLSSCSNVCM